MRAVSTTLMAASPPSGSHNGIANPPIALVDRRPGLVDRGPDPDFAGDSLDRSRRAASVPRATPLTLPLLLSIGPAMRPVLCSRQPAPDARPR